jgi:hypothetical protein
MKKIAFLLFSLVVLYVGTALGMSNLSSKSWNKSQQKDANNFYDTLRKFNKAITDGISGKDRDELFSNTKAALNRLYCCLFLLSNDCYHEKRKLYDATEETITTVLEKSDFDGIKLIYKNLPTSLLIKSAAVSNYLLKTTDKPSCKKINFIFEQLKQRNIYDNSTAYHTLLTAIKRGFTSIVEKLCNNKAIKQYYKKCPSQKDTKKLIEEIDKTKHTKEIKNRMRKAINNLK